MKSLGFLKENHCSLIAQKVSSLPIKLSFFKELKRARVVIISALDAMKLESVKVMHSSYEFNVSNQLLLFDLLVCLLFYCKSFVTICVCETLSVMRHAQLIETNNYTASDL